MSAIEYVEWIKAMAPQTGQQLGDYIGMHIVGKKFVSGSTMGAWEPFEFVLTILPDGALHIVAGIAELINGPQPPTINLPGRN